MSESSHTSGSASSRGALSLFVKLTLVISSLVVACTTLLALYLPSRQIEEMRATLDTKALTYGRLVGKQVESAVAFDDQQTAREVFDSVAQDLSGVRAQCKACHEESRQRYRKEMRTTRLF